MAADNKMRWGGLLENPFISKVQRSLLDYGSVSAIRKILDPFEFKSTLDVGCGIGDYASLRREKYVGLDNSLRSVTFASKRYKNCFFACGNALTLPFQDKSFDLALMIEISHHLSDEDFRRAIDEMARVTKRYILIEDPVRFEHQNKISSFIYDLDRGSRFRYSDEMRNVFQGLGNVQIKAVESYQTFPGLYVHEVFLLEVQA